MSTDSGADAPVALVLNGPNLNMLGVREPEIYGWDTLADIERLCAQACTQCGWRLDFRQTNHEGEMIDWIQQARGRAGGIVINAGGWTHTSVAIHDALRIAALPVVEVHLSDPKTREPFRHVSYIEPVAFAGFSGMGSKGYVMAIEALSTHIAPAKPPVL